jgi:hypothetical protein
MAAQLRHKVHLARTRRLLMPVSSGHTALAALAQLRQAVIRNAVCGGIQFPAALRPRTRPGRTALPPTATTTLATLTCAYRSAAHRSPHTHASPARTALG